MGPIAKLFIITVILFDIIPTESTAQWTRSNCGIVGDVGSLAVQGSKIYAGTWGGIFRSSDEGESWQLVSPPLPGEGGSLTRFAVSENRLILTTSYICPLFGTEWTHSDSGMVGGPYPALNTSRTSMAASGTRVYAATWGGLFISTDVGISWYRSNTLGTYMASLVVARGPELYAGLRGGSIYYSSDYGDTGSTSMPAWE